MKKSLLRLSAAVALLAAATFATAAPPEQVPRTPQVMEQGNPPMKQGGASVQKHLFVIGAPDRTVPAEHAFFASKLPAPWIVPSGVDDPVSIGNASSAQPFGITKLDVQAGFNPPISIHGGGSGGMLDPRLNENGGSSRWQMAGAGGSSCVTSGIPTPHERMPVSFTT